jgi:phage terminase small subunit
MNALTQRQRAFCHEYLVDLNATQAAIRAGYSRRTANEQAARALAKVSVQAEVQRLLEERKKRVGVDADFVVRTLVENVQRSMQAVPVRVANGEAIGEYRYDGHVVNKALELLGRHLGIFSDRVKHEFGGGVQLDFVSLVKQLENRRSNVIDGEMIEQIANADG